MPSKKKKYSARFPPARIKKIMQTDEEVGKVNAAVPVIISRALEMFIEGLILKTGQTTQMRNAKTLSTAHIKHTILSEKKFDFLKDLVANIPDVQGEDECEGGMPATKTRVPRDPNQPRKVGRPRKQVDPNENTVRRGRPRKERNTSSTSSGSYAGENSDMDDEDTETDEEEQPSYETNGPDSTQHQSPPAVPVNSGQQPSTSSAVPYQYQQPSAMMAHLPPTHMMASLTSIPAPTPPSEDDDYDT